jgi:hypothetical protein
MYDDLKAWKKETVVAGSSYYAWKTKKTLQNSLPELRKSIKHA